MDFDSLIKKYKFDTGDIILYERKNSYKSWSDYLFNFIDGGIKYFTGSKYTHAAMIVKNPPWNFDLQGLYILESNRENIPDVEDNKLKCGVELIPLKKVFENKENNYYIRKLHCKKNYSFNRKLIQAHKEVYNKPYDLDLIDWIKAGLNLDIGNTHKTNTFWCSALVSYLYYKLGLLRYKSVASSSPSTNICPILLSTGI